MKIRKDSSYHQPNIQVSKKDRVKISKTFNFIAKLSPVEMFFYTSV